MKIEISAAVLKLWRVLPYNDQPCIINLITMAARTHTIIMFCLRDQFYFLWKIGGLKNATVVWLCASMYFLFFFGFVLLYFFFIDIKSDVWHSANCCFYYLKMLRINLYYYFADICAAASTWSRFSFLSAFVKGTLQYSYLSVGKCCRCGLFYSFCLCYCTSV